MALVFPYIWIPNGGVGPVEIVSWKRGTDEQIKAMIDAADAGEINLSDYWSVGDKRTVHLSAISANPDGAFPYAMDEQDVVHILMNEGYSGEGNEHVNFVWGQQDCLSKYGRMHRDSSVVSWRDCDMRVELNDKYYNALPVTYKSCLKQFNVITPETYNSSTTQTSRDYISLFSGWEIYHTSSYINPIERTVLSGIEYLNAVNINLIKKIGSSEAWWLSRSPAHKPDYGAGGEVTGFYELKQTTSKGDFAVTRPSGTCGIAPFGCI